MQHKHTPPPWKGFNLDLANKYMHQKIGPAVIKNQISREDACHILKCVNNHDRLVKALRVTLEIADDHPSKPSTGHIHEILEELENDQ